MQRKSTLITALLTYRRCWPCFACHVTTCSSPALLGHLESEHNMRRPLALSHLKELYPNGQQLPNILNHWLPQGINVLEGNYTLSDFPF